MPLYYSHYFIQLVGMADWRVAGEYMKASKPEYAEAKCY